MIVHLIDGTYELFRHFYGLRRFNKGKDKPFGAVVGVLNGVLQMIEEGATYLGVATDHVIESFRNSLWHDSDLLALVGDSADGYPGIPGIGKIGAARLLNKYGPIEAFPKRVLGKQREMALLFKRLATLRTDAPLFSDVSQLQWRGPTPTFEELTRKLDEPCLLTRANAVATKFLHSSR